MRKSNLISSAVATLLLGIGLHANAQDVVLTQQVTQSGDTVTIIENAPRSTDTHSVDQQVWDMIRSTEGYDSIPDDALLPITQDQAEELITKLILEARKPYVEAAYRDSVVRAFKVETLKRRALDQALARTFNEPLERRLDQMERLLYALLLTRGDLSPEAINHLLGGNLLPQGAIQKTDTVPANQLAGRREPVTPDEAIALKGGLNNKEIDLYMSVAYFGFDSSKLDSEAIKTLDNVVEWMKENDLRVSLRGYASPEGKMSYNNNSLVVE